MNVFGVTENTPRRFLILTILIQQQQAGLSVARWSCLTGPRWFIEDANTMGMRCSAREQPGRGFGAVVLRQCVTHATVHVCDLLFTRVGENGRCVWSRCALPQIGWKDHVFGILGAGNNWRFPLSLPLPLSLWTRPEIPTVGGFTAKRRSWTQQQTSSLKCIKSL